MNDKAEDETIKGRIIALLEKGYKRDQLIKDFKFVERTVDAAIRAYKELNNGDAGEPKEDDRPIADDVASRHLLSTKARLREVPNLRETAPWRFVRKMNPCYQSPWTTWCSKCRVRSFYYDSCDSD